MQLLTTILMAAAFTLLYGSFIFFAGTGLGDSRVVSCAQQMQNTLSGRHMPSARSGHLDITTVAAYDWTRITQHGYWKYRNFCLVPV